MITWDQYKIIVISIEYRKLDKLVIENVALNLNNGFWIFMDVEFRRKHLV